MLSLDSADTGISETGEKTRRVRYARFVVYFHVRARRDEREDWEKERTGRAAGDRERRERQHVRPMSVESDETLLRLCSGNIPRKRRINSPSEVSDVSNVRTGRGEAFKVLSSRRFPDARGRWRERWRNIEENAHSISTNSLSKSNA